MRDGREESKQFVGIFAVSPPLPSTKEQALERGLHPQGRGTYLNLSSGSQPASCVAAEGGLHPASHSYVYQRPHTISSAKHGDLKFSSLARRSIFE